MCKAYTWVSLFKIYDDKLMNFGILILFIGWYYISDVALLLNTLFEFLDKILSKLERHSSQSPSNWAY